ncbi:hypothetical protein [Rhizobium sp. 2MFCol3.1]|uniref:hypothetical protein n=1 Tax=Rhizobium sp. 2MFCol3.1 TaxID=1246459 RepID=UPI0003A2097D|nr:hypothetical protein [Rhizobium sp. 2MFCol3.1]
MNANHRTMQLIGYEKVTEELTGFCTGLYTPLGKSNEVFVALPSIEGAADSSVAAFTPVFPRHATYLGEKDVGRALSIGDRWKDVLLIDGELLFGTRDELYEEVGASIKQLVADFPFTAIDLVRDRKDGVRRFAIGKAFDRISSTFDRSSARSWVLGTYFRTQILTHLRRKLHHHNASPTTFEALRHIQIQHTQDLREIEVVLPGFHVFDEGDVAPLLALDRDREAYALLSDLPEELGKASLAGRVQNGKLLPLYRPKEVLVVSIGRAGEQLSRIIMNAGGKPRFIIDANWPTRLFVRTTAAELQFVVPNDFSFIMVLAGDDLTIQDRRDYDHLMALAEGRLGLPVLVVPSLPTYGPSDHLFPADRQKMVEFASGTMLLDTSVLRSPALSGDSASSVSRRIADLAVQTSLLLLSSANSLQRVARVFGESRDICLRVTLVDNGDLARGIHLPSEAVMLREPKQKLTVRKLISPIGSPIRRRSSSATAGNLYELTIHQLRYKDISDLAIAAVTRVLERNGMGEVARKVGDTVFPPGVDLDFPHLTAVINVELDETVCLLVTVETPSIATIVAFERVGIQVVRYSDEQTLQRVVAANGLGRFKHVLPADIKPLGPHLPVDERTPFSKADGLPGLVVNLDEWHSWLDRFPNHSLASQARIVVPTGIRRDSGSRVVAISHSDLDTFTLATDEGVDLLREKALQNSARTGIGRILLKPEHQTPESDRWVFRSGRSPVVMWRLPRGYTVGEGWTVFDGDEYSVAMITSNVFDVWMRMGTGRRTGSERRWTEATMDQFPWPEGFVREGNEVRCVAPTDQFESACGSLRIENLTLDFQDLSPKALRREVDPEHREYLTRAAMTMFGLDGTESEIRLVEALLMASDTIKPY